MKDALGRKDRLDKLEGLIIVDTHTHTHTHIHVYINFS